MLTNHEILHGTPLSKILDILIEAYDFTGLDNKLKMNCFASNPSKKSSLNFLRKTPWARDKVEELYIDLIRNSTNK